MSELGDPMETISCSNCKRDILKANFVIHELHCQRYIYLCSKCNEPVNIKQKDLHDKANHVLVFCKNCHIQIEKYKLSGHLTDDCRYRKLKCQICDIDVNANDIFEHENYCGARTEKCSECGEYIMFKYKQLHIDSNHTFIKLSDEPGPSPSWKNGRCSLRNFFPDSESITRKSQTHQKKKSGKSENMRRRGRELLEYIGNDDETAKKSSNGECSSEGTFLEKIDKITRDLEEFKGNPGFTSEYKAEKQTFKKSFSTIAASPRIDNTNVDSDLNKDTRNRAKKGKGIPSKKDGTFSKRLPKETSDSDQKTKFSNETDDKFIARAVEENAAVLSEFSLFDSSEKNKRLPGKNLSENTFNGKPGKSVRKPRLYELDDSTGDEFLLYSTKPENELDYDGLPCQFCGSLYSPRTLMSHQQMCDLNTDSDLFPRKKIQ